MGHHPTRKERRKERILEKKLRAYVALANAYNGNGIGKELDPKITKRILGQISRINRPRKGIARLTAGYLGEIAAHIYESARTIPNDRTRSLIRFHAALEVTKAHIINNNATNLEFWRDSMRDHAEELRQAGVKTGRSRECARLYSEALALTIWDAHARQRRPHMNLDLALKCLASEARQKAIQLPAGMGN